MKNKSFIIFRILFNIVLISIFLFFVLQLIEKDLVLGRELNIKSDLHTKNPFISVIFPEHRAINKRDYYEINDEPVYFTVRSPINFDRAEVSVEFDPGKQEVIDIGYADNKEGWSYQMHTLYNTTLDNIKWNKLEDKKNTLWQRNKKFVSMDDFYGQILNTDGIGAYDFKIGEHFLIKNYIKGDKQIEITNCIRGEHKFYTYIKDEPLNFTLKVYDINRSPDEDPIFINVYNNNEKIIYSKMIEDSNKKTDGADENPKYITIFIPNLKEGAYKIEFLSNDDNIIRSITTTQTKLTFIDKIYLCDNPEYAYKFFNLALKPTNLYTTGNTLSFYTAHKNGLQNISINDTNLSITKQHEWYNFNNGSKMSKIFIPKNDIKLSTRGLMALSYDMFFNPEMLDLKNYSDSSDIKYIIAQYKTPQKTNDTWLKNNVYFDLQNTKIENGSLKFIISSPELKFNKTNIKIKNISVKLISDEKISKEASYKRLLTPIYNNIINYYNLLKNKFQFLWHLK